MIKREIFNNRFSLHDSRIIEIKKEGKDLTFITDCGIVDMKDDEQKNGHFLIKDVDFLSSYAYILKYKNVLCGNLGEFEGLKITLEGFIKRYHDYYLDIIGEYQGYKTIFLTGFLSKDDEIFEYFLDVFYNGDFLYILD